jgi:surfeit locus 1 family protein
LTDRSWSFRLTLFCLIGIAFFTSLGVWQLERRAWKLALIAQVDARVRATVVAAPSLSADTALTHEAYLHVKAAGHFLNDRETLVQAVTERGPGFWVMTPFVTDAGFTILVNRGFVPPERRNPVARAAGQVAGETEVTGLLRLTEPKGGFLRRNDPADNRWYSRDVAAIAKARGLTDVAPYFIDAAAMPNPGGLPIGGLTVIAFPNHHLSYALTWFALALMLAFMLVRGALSPNFYIQASKSSIRIGRR